MKSKLTVSIVIPNWNGAQLIKQYLSQVIESTKEALEIIIVDDASTDNSVLLIKDKFPSVRLIQKDHHEGFASTVNVGVQEAKGEVVVLLNSDVVPERGFLSYLTPHFDDKNLFAVGCEDQSEENNRVILRGRGKASWQKGFYIHSRGEVDKYDTAWVSGGSGAFRRSIWLALGGMDPLYNPFYWEDIDISYRALKSGYHLIFEPKSRVFHYHEEGKIRNEFSGTKVSRISYRNQFIFIWKNLSDIRIFVAHLCWTPIRLVQTLVHGDSGMINGFINALFLLPEIVKARNAAARTWINKDSEIIQKE